MIRFAKRCMPCSCTMRSGRDGYGDCQCGQSARVRGHRPDLRDAIEDVLFNRRDDATERLLELAQNYRKTGKQPAAEQELAWRSLPAGERLTYALVHGIADLLPMTSRKFAAQRSVRWTY